MNTSIKGTAVAYLGTGHVWHRRLRPSANSFRYPSYFVMLSLREWPHTGSAGLARNRRGLLSFFDADHGLGGPNALAWFDQLLKSEGILDATGPVWLQTYPRVLGFAFKPVSFWYAHRADGTSAAVLVEVNNTFGERHCYLLRAPSLHWGAPVQADKVFHVSPFCELEGTYHFRFLRTDAVPKSGATAPNTPPRVLVRVDLHDLHGPLLQTSLGGQLLPISTATAQRAFWGMPLMTWGVVARIHWQALRLALKRVPFFRKPLPPKTFVTR